jgi:hypothetical protein
VGPEQSGDAAGLAVEFGIRYPIADRLAVREKCEG